jgi:hypothetical protein
MSISTFFIGLLIVGVLAIFIRIFWLELFIIWTLLKGLFWISVGATISAIFWMVFIENYQSGPIDGFWLTWTFFFITYITVSVVCYLILIDAYQYFKGFIRDLLRK